MDWSKVRERIAGVLYNKAKEDAEIRETLIKRACQRLVDEAWATAQAKDALVKGFSSNEDKASKAALAVLERRLKGLGRLPKALKQVAKLAKDGHIDQGQFAQMVQALGYQVAEDGQHVVVLANDIEIARFKF